MIHYRSLLSICSAIVVSTLIAIPAFGQSGSYSNKPTTPSTIDANLYSGQKYSGSGFRVTGPRATLNLRWRVQSVRIGSGRWQLCEQYNYRGRCLTLDQDSPTIGAQSKGMIVQSIRPIGQGWNNGNGGSGGGYGGGDANGGNGNSLRGLASEFFPFPTINGRRVTTCEKGDSSTSCGPQQADRFCASNGWRSAERQGSQIIDRQRYLADVLCTNEPRPL